MPFRIFIAGGLLSALCLAAHAQPHEPEAHTLSFAGTERVYYIALPAHFDPETTYWPLVVVHGGGGNAQTNPKAAAMRRMADEADLPAIVIQPQFNNTDRPVSRFPVLGESDFLKAVLKAAGETFKLREKILLTGYSMGGQLTHRFALANPHLVQACATFSAGTWTTPDGRLLIEEYGEVKDPKNFLSVPENAGKIPERLSDLFDARTAAVAGLPAAQGAEAVPFLVMCGTEDTRYGIAVEFAESLKKSGFMVETEWPRTPHSSNAEEYEAEFAKYPAHAVRFFNQQVESR